MSYSISWVASSTASNTQTKATHHVQPSFRAVTSSPQSASLYATLAGSRNSPPWTLVVATPLYNHNPHLPFGCLFPCVLPCSFSALTVTNMPIHQTATSTTPNLNMPTVHHPPPPGYIAYPHPPSLDTGLGPFPATASCALRL